ncbi:PD-(D/E)XK nuclease family protein [Dehalobacter sp.]|uniref:PD-(D/E)XK nuclease family protein n=1 Tax=Dehalobacter sp. TaxID=1962289 RepID=UPI00258E143D|nr:PD-(D/E)XK nuclease family protein [Dehalobacter sp.]
MIKLPIRQLVELIMRCGDIDSRYASKDRMAEGAKAHRILQKRNRETYEDYRSEVSLSEAYCYNGIDYTLEGRADGIFSCEGRTVIEEIKTTVLPLDSIDKDFSGAHWAQAKCYAYIYAVQNALTEAVVQLTYFNLETNETKQWLNFFAISELTEFIGSLIQKYSVWASFSAEWAEIRDPRSRRFNFLSRSTGRGSGSWLYRPTGP